MYRFSKISTISLLVALVSIFSCSTPEEKVAIKGTVNNGEIGEKILLWELKVSNASPIDSVVLDESGSFKFDPTPYERTFYRITRKNNEGILISIDSTESVNITVDATKFTSAYTIEGSKESGVLKDLGVILKENFEAKDSLNKAYQANYSSMTEELVITFQNRLMQIEEEFKVELGKFIENNPNSLATLVAIENLDIDQHFELYEMVDKHIGEMYPNSSYFQAFHKNFEYSSQLTKGHEVPDIVLPNTEGVSTSLSSLRGKIVLIDFWASWCKPCRAENPNVVKLYNKYKDKNFEIFGVSLDQSKEAWLNAIQQDGLSWIHVSDLRLWQSAVVKLYNIQGIPLTILIDENGEIIAKNLRGEALAQKLEELFVES